MMLSTRNSHHRRTGVAIILMFSLFTTGCANNNRPAATEQVSAIEALADREEVNNGSTVWNTDKKPENTAKYIPGCTPVLLITARGTDEPPQTGNLLSPVMRHVRDTLVNAHEEYRKNPVSGGSNPYKTASLLASTNNTAIFSHYDLEYSATAEFGDSSPEGMRRLIDTVNNQATLCPDQKILLAGYSQGAFVIAESLTKADQRLIGPGVGEITESAAAQIAGIIFYGDPRFVSNEPYTYGTFKPGRDGTLPRLPGALDAHATKIRSFCVATDIVCQSMQAVREDGHVEYFKNGMQQLGAEFLLERLANSYRE